MCALFDSLSKLKSVWNEHHSIPSGFLNWDKLKYLSNCIFKHFSFTSHMLDIPPLLKIHRQAAVYFNVVRCNVLDSQSLTVAHVDLKPPVVGRKLTDY